MPSSGWTLRKSATAAPDRALQQGHEVQIVDAALLDVVELFPHAVERFGKAVDVHEHADQIAPLVPAGVLNPAAVDPAHLLAALVKGAQQHLQKILVSVLVVAVERHVQPAQLVLVPRQTLPEKRIPSQSVH